MMRLLFDLFLPIRYEQQPQYLEAVAWYGRLVEKPFELPEGDDFALEFGADRFRELTDAKNKIEDKADALLKLVSTFGAAAAAGLIALHKAGDVGRIPCLLTPFLIVLGLTAIVCVTIRITAPWPAPFDPNFVLDRLALGENPRKTRTITAASLHCAVVGARYVVKRLSQRLKVASWLTAIALLLLSLLVFA